MIVVCLRHSSSVIHSSVTKEDDQRQPASHLVVFVPVIACLDAVEISGLAGSVLLHPLLNQRSRSD